MASDTARTHNFATPKPLPPSVLSPARNVGIVGRCPNRPPMPRYDRKDGRRPHTGPTRERSKPPVRTTTVARPGNCAPIPRRRAGCCPARFRRHPVADGVGQKTAPPHRVEMVVAEDENSMRLCHDLPVLEIGGSSCSCLLACHRARSLLNRSARAGDSARSPRSGLSYSPAARRARQNWNSRASGQPSGLSRRASPSAV